MMDASPGRLGCGIMAAWLVAAWPAMADQSGAGGAGSDLRRGQELYNASCVVCHGPAAKGDIGPKLAGHPVLSDDAAFHKILSEGRHIMPPLKGLVTEEQLRDIRAWLRSLP